MQQNKKRLLIGIALVLIGISLLLSAMRGLPYDANKWQAVFLTDGQVYFGKLSDSRGDFAKLSSVYYLKYSDGLQQDKPGSTGDVTTRNLNLIKLGGEAHGPDGTMYISKDKILFIENLKENSPVVQAIANSK